MGVTGLWPILAPSARPTPLPTLNRKRLAVDASIWIYQFLKAVRDKEGNALRNSHVVGFFRRICKLLFYGIKPVFVFDGGAPILKRQTIQARKRRREGRREDAVKTAGKLLAVQMQRRGEEEEAKRKKDAERERKGLNVHVDDGEDVIKEGDSLVYVGEMGMSVQERNQNRKFRKTDQYHLPELENGIEGMGQPNDPRIMSAEELEEYARQFNNGEDVNLYDFSKIDFNGEFFRSLPAGDRYNILNAARLRSRLRMGLSKDQLEEMFPDRMAFSRFQIDRVRERNELTQRLMNLNGMNGDMAGVGGGRIAGERGREYVLVKNDGVEGGWALGVVSTDKGVGERNKPIDVDALNQKVEKTDDSEDEDEFEDVPVEGLNRLPKRPADTTHNFTYADFQTKELVEQRRALYASRNPDGSRYSSQPPEEDDSLFVDEDPMEGPSSYRPPPAIDEEDEDLNMAIALSLQQDADPAAVPIESDDEDHFNRAIALSMQKQHRQESEDEDEADFEDVPMPQFEQRVAEPAKPIGKSSGGIIAHIVNNRANAAVPKRKAPSTGSGSDSDEDGDLHTILAKARRRKAPEKQRQPAPVVTNVKNPFDGPLPFEKLGSIFSKKGKQAEISTPGSNGVDEDSLAGGFDTTLEKDDKPRPLPPWMTGAEDIRTQVREQRKMDKEINAADRERRLEDEAAFRKKNAPVRIDSSDDEDDFEIVEGPPPTKASETFGEIAEAIRAKPPVSDIPQDRQPSVHSNAHGEDELVNSTPHENEEVEWSESDYGDAVPKTGNAKSPAKEKTDDDPSKSPSPEFEDVEVSQPGQNLEEPTIDSGRKSPEVEFEDVNMPDSAAVFPSVPGPSLPIDESFDRQLDAEFDFSDPEDEELLAQLAIEAEEHARFASTLNNKSEKENQDAYEKELKALRTQQKKDRRDADEVSHIMVTECQALLRLFGLPYITAPMEAEAQCAELVRLGLVDGVVTDDCDIFLFGGTRVYKNMFNSNKYVECYLANDIEKELSLSRDQLIALAHFLGSDYTEGLPGVGPVTAVELLSEFPSADGLEEFKAWWNDVQLNAQPIKNEITTFRKKFRRAQGTKLFLPAGFPSPAVTEAYLKPDVDPTPEPFQWGVPDLDQLREFLMATIGWTQERTDEVLVPVIRDMNRREQEGTQSNITRFFDGAVGAGATGINDHRKEGGSKRMREAVGKLKAKKKSGNADGDQPLGAGSKTFAKHAAEWAKNNDLRWTPKDERPKKGRGKGKRKADAEVEPEGDDECEVGEVGEGSVRPDDEEADDESAVDSADEFRAAVAKKNGKGKGKAKSTAKRKRVKV